MEKIKNLLSPGKSTDDEVLYGSDNNSAISPNTDGRPALGGQPLQQGNPGNTDPLSGSSNKDTSPALETQGSSTIKGHKPSANTSSKAAEDTSSGLSSQHHTTNPTSSTQDFESTRSGHAEPLGADVSPEHSAFISAANEDLRPQPRTPASAASNASIKSNIVGKVPSGSTLTSDSTESGALPPVPATDGKFMNTEAPTGGPRTQNSEDRAFPLVGGATTSGLASSSAGHGPHATETANRLDPNVGSSVDKGLGRGVEGNTGATTTQSTDQLSSTPITKDNKQNERDGALFGGILAGVGAHKANKHREQSQDDYNKGVGTTASSATTGISDYAPTKRSGDNDKHQGRENAQMGGGFLAGVGAHEANNYRDQSQLGPTGSDDYSKNSTAHAGTFASVPSGSGTKSLSPANQAANAATLSQEKNSRHMPGAYPETPSIESENTLGRDTATAQTGGPAAIAAREAFRRHEVEQPTEQTETNPYRSTLDPRVDGSRGTRKAGISSTGDGKATNAHQESAGGKYKEAETKDHNFGKDALVVSGAGAAAVGAYEAKQHHDKEDVGAVSQDSRVANSGTPQHSTTGPQGTLGEKILDAQEKERFGGGNTAATLGGAGLGTSAYGASADHDNSQLSSRTEPAPYTTTQPRQSEASAPGLTKPLEDEFAARSPKDADEKRTGHPHGSDAALAGAGGAGLYETYKYHTEKEDALQPASANQSTNFSRPTGSNQLPVSSSVTPDANDPLSSSAHPKALENYSNQRAYPTSGAHLVGHEPTPESDVTETDGSHHHGKDAALVGGGAVATAGGPHEYSKHHEDKLEREREKTAEQKHNEALKHDKEIRKHEEKEKKHEEKEKKHEEKDKKPGLISRILHHHKHKESTDEEHQSRQSHEKSRHSAEKYREEGIGAADASALVHDHDHDHGRHDRNRLHKDPPPGYLSDTAREGHEHGSSTSHIDPSTGMDVNTNTTMHENFPLNPSEDTATSGGASRIGG